ncbi:MAG: tetratricopeptide repeat protein [Candidatus Rokubacteria bacterium]|nr:tetratricopeptide repeat protein [Candidatus Rokubacteria bacterium]
MKQILPVILIALPGLLLVLWPLFRRGAAGRAATGTAPTSADDRRIELSEEKASVYRALKEIEFDHEAGHLSEEDYRPIRDRYESRAAALLHALDALGAEPGRKDERARPEAVAAPASRRRGWTRHPAVLAGGAALLLVFGVFLGLNIGRFTQPDPGAMPQGGMTMPMPPTPGGSAGAEAPTPAGPPQISGQPVTPEVMAGMLQAARQSLEAGQYQQAISAYQAVLKRDPKNVDAMTHLARIVAIGGHGDSALETFGKALQIDPNYAPAYLYRGQVLYEVKQDSPGAIKAWERFLVLVPKGEEHDQVKALIEKARSQKPTPPAR